MVNARRWVTVSGLVVAIICLAVFGRAADAVTSGEPTHYSAEAIDGRVVDEATGQPLSGVAIAVTWDLHGGLHGTHVKWLMLADTVTDEVLPASVWVEVKAAAVEVDRRLEVLPVA